MSYPASSAVAHATPGGSVPGRHHWEQTALTLALAAVLLALGAANILVRARVHDVEDGVLWVAGQQGVTARAVAADSPASDAGVRAGDVLLAIDGRPVSQPADVLGVLRQSTTKTQLHYTLLRIGQARLVQIGLQPVPRGNVPIYFALAIVGVFTLLVGASVRLRRPFDQATLHFFWLCVAFFGVFTFSFSGSLNQLDWIFYWADDVATLLLPPLFLHFTLVFPERRPRSWTRLKAVTALVPLVYVPGVALGVARVLAVTRASDNELLFTGTMSNIDRGELVYLAVCFLAGLAVLLQARQQALSGTARRQLRWILWGTALGAGPFAVLYALPWALGFNPPVVIQLTAVLLGLLPLTFASAIVRYRLMDVEVIIKRGLVYTAVVSAIVTIYAVLLRVAAQYLATGTAQHNSVIALLATLVVVLLARPVKNAMQDTLDRVFYRDRYDYRRALVGFARDLNSDLDLDRLSDRLVTRVMETLEVERMALMLGDEQADEFLPIGASGFPGGTPPLSRQSGIGGRIERGATVALDDPLAAARFSAEEIEFWRDTGIYYFVPCVFKENAIAVLALGRKGSGEPLNSEDMALLTAVAGQVATALENGRLFRQLQMKADELDRMREFNENILESLDDGLVVLDVGEQIVRWNHALEQMCGLARAQVVGRRLDEVFEPAFVEALRDAWKANPGGAALYRVPLARPGGGDRLLVNVTIVPLQAPGAAGVVTAGTIALFEDITGRVRLEEQLQISEKMASIGLLAAGVAHEVNTPLTGISSFTQMLLKGADPSDPRTRVLEKIERQTFRAAKIVNGLLNLSRPTGAGGNDFGPVDVHEVIADVLSLLEHQLEVGNIKVRRELVASPAVVRAIEHQLQQVFLNLFMNARDAMPKGGWLSVSTHVDGTRLVIEIGDTGSGIPAEHLARIYDPFFSTKAIGQGTGLGLSITYGIVREHEGTIQCDSVVGQGTRFALTLPLSTAGQRVTRAVN
ncbi:MAG: GAF domain-containing protein [Acidobacteriota bacterium]|nr:GAF domain-containing protein [Acidobacteriota bacterium]